MKKIDNSDRGRRGKGEAKDAAGASPVEETDERAIKIEEETSGLKEGLSEAKALLKPLIEGERVDGGVELEEEDRRRGRAEDEA